MTKPLALAALFLAACAPTSRDLARGAAQLAPGDCDPYRDGSDHVSSADCTDPSKPVCDALERTCVVAPIAACGACNDDADCPSAQHCVTLDGVGSEYAPNLHGPDRACVASCDGASSDSCRALSPTLGCFPAPGETFVCATGSGSFVSPQPSCWNGDERRGVR